MVLYKARTTEQNKVLFAQKLAVTEQKVLLFAQKIIANEQNELLLMMKKSSSFFLINDVLFPHLPSFDEPYRKDG